MSLRRYEKATIVPRHFEQLSAAAQDYGKFMDRNLNKLLLGQLRAPRPPGLTAL